jgi:hypothetical protein
MGASLDTLTLKGGLDVNEVAEIVKTALRKKFPDEANEVISATAKENVTASVRKAVAEKYPNIPAVKEAAVITTTPVKESIFGKSTPEQKTAEVDTPPVKKPVRSIFTKNAPIQPEDEVTRLKLAEQSEIVKE